MTGGGHAPLSDVNVQKIYLFLSFIMWVGHSQRETLKDYWSILEQSLVAICGTAVTRDVSCIEISTLQ
jgi:hypothetical protein